MSIQVIRDNHFKKGFHLMRPDFEHGDPRATERKFDYLGTAEPEQGVTWQLAQWGTRRNFGECSERKGEDGFYYYEDPVRTFAANPETGELKMYVDAGKIFGATPRQSGAEAWPHMLIEQGFTDVRRLTNVKAIYATLDFELVKMDSGFADPKQFDPNLHAAQLLWYFTIGNTLTPEEAASGKLGKPGDYIWFGLPIFDNRNPLQDESWQYDKGTSHFIYGISNKDFLPEAASVGKRLRFRIDILPYMHRALDIVQGLGGMKDVKFENLAFNYFNFGWEIPGSFNVGVDIHEINVEIED